MKIYVHKKKQLLEFINKKLHKLHNLSKKVRIFQQNVHFFYYLYAHFEKKCVTLHRFLHIEVPPRQIKK